VTSQARREYERAATPLAVTHPDPMADQNCAPSFLVKPPSRKSAGQAAKDKGCRSGGAGGV
jgi:hypothetical protein